MRPDWFSLTALVTGSLAPDFEYFIKMNGEREYAHTIAGLFWFDLPAGIILALVFHNILKRPLFNHVTPGLQRRLVRYNGFDWNSYAKVNWLIVLVSVFIGSCSHLFLDSFTNQNGYFVKRIPFLQSAVSLPYSQIYVSNILALVLSIGGLIAIVWAVFQLGKSRRVHVNRHISPYWIIILVLTSAIFYLRMQTVDARMKLYWHLYPGTYMIIIISAFVISLILTSLFFRLRYR
jgi:hypothetical protein